MIRRIEDSSALPANTLARLAAAQPDMLAALWLQAFGQVRGALALYDCGSDVLLAVHAGQGVLCGSPPLHRYRELRAFLPFAGVHTLYTRTPLPLVLPHRAAPLLCMRRTPDAGANAALPQQESYAAAARLVCGDLSEQAMMDFYADLCTRRNRGLVRVLRLGPDAEPIGCVALAGPLPLAAGAGGPTALYFSDLTVAHAHRRRGHGAALLRAAEAEALALGAKSLLLHCAPALERYYARRGWQTCGKIWKRSL